MSAVLAIARAEELEPHLEQIDKRLQVLLKVRALRGERALLSQRINLIDRELEALAEPLRLALLDLPPRRRGSV